MRYPNPIDARAKLQERGFINDFTFKDGRLKCRQTGIYYPAEDLRIVEYHRFEGASNPSDMSIIFALAADDGTKGLITSSFGTYANMDLISFLDQVKVKENQAVGNGV